jgi:uncharacterized damage-inducible protein DinB
VAGNPLAELFRYNAWANQRLIAVCSGLTEEQLTAPTPGGDARAIRSKLLHVVGGQQTFALRTKGRQHEGELNAGSAWPGWDRLIEVERESSAELIRIAEELQEDVEMVLPYMGMRPRYPVSFFLTHALVHGAQHRTEIALALAVMGVEPPDLEGWAYAEAMGYGPEG